MKTRLAVAFIILSGCLTVDSCNHDETAPVQAAAPTESISAFLSQLPAQDLEQASLQLTDLILRASEEEHAPRRDTVHRFARAVVTAYAGRSVPPEIASRIETCMHEVLQSAGTSTSQFRHHVKEFERAVRDSKVPPVQQKTLADMFEGLGKQVRGPEDMPFGQ